MKPNIKDIVKGNTAKFDRYRKQNLYYRVEVTTDDGVKTYEFPVPIEDCGDASFFGEDKAMLFMRYIRKALNEDTFALVG